MLPPATLPCRVKSALRFAAAFPSTSAIHSYYGQLPNCKEADRGLLGGTVLHYTGARMRGNPKLGCQPTKMYAQVLLEVGRLLALLCCFLPLQGAPLRVPGACTPQPGERRQQAAAPAGEGGGRAAAGAGAHAGGPRFRC